MVLIPESDTSVLINQLALAQNCQSLLPMDESELGLDFTWRTHNVKQMPNQHFLVNVTTTQLHKTCSMPVLWSKSTSVA